MEDLFIKSEEGLFITGLPAGTEVRWTLKRKHFTKAIDAAANTMPGPDGIPAAAYKHLGGFASDILFNVAQVMCQGNSKPMFLSAYADRDTPGDHGFNHSLLCCLPKKTAGDDPNLGSYYSGECTRPLALVNVDNRLIASAARMAWEPLLELYISKHQQGFLKGRNMLSNIIDIDYQAMTVSLKCAKGAIFLFDFKAAFPSVSHEFLINSLSSIGVPPHALAFIKALYENNHCDISYKGCTYEGFGMYCGVRQGCPISPLLFAAAIDVLLRRIQQKIPSGMVRAFADDIGLVVEEWAREWSTAQGIFQEFATMSGLELNVPKTVCIPLWPKGIQDIPNDPSYSNSIWKDIDTSMSGTYLGFSIGPGKGTSSWNKPLAKYTKRVEKWKSLGAGQQFAVVAYNSLALSTLLFIAQLENPPEQVLREEVAGIRRTLGGPGNWYDPKCDPYFLKEWYGQNKSFGSLSIISQAAQLRTLHSHNITRQSGRTFNRTSVADMHSALQNDLANPDHCFQAGRWRQWYAGSHASVLYRNSRSLAASGLSLQQCLVAIAGEDPVPWSDKVKSKQKRSLQKFVTTAIKNKLPQQGLNNIRKHLHRFMDSDAGRPSDKISQVMKIPGPPAWVASKVYKNLQRLHSLAPPRVCAAAWRVISNAWCTHRRFQKRTSVHNTCLLGCGGEDSIEHYSRCAIVKDALFRKCRISLEPRRGLAVFCMATDEQRPDDVLALTMLCVYAVYMTTNHYRTTSNNDSTAAKNCIGQHIIQGCQGHTQLTKLVQERWNSPLLYIR